VTKSLRRI